VVRYFNLNFSLFYVFKIEQKLNTYYKIAFWWVNFQPKKILYLIDHNLSIFEKTWQHKTYLQKRLIFHRQFLLVFSLFLLNPFSVCFICKQKLGNLDIGVVIFLINQAEKRVQLVSLSHLNMKVKKFWY